MTRAAVQRSRTRPASSAGRSRHVLPPSPTVAGAPAFFQRTRGGL